LIAIAVGESACELVRITLRTTAAPSTPVTIAGRASFERLARAAVVSCDNADACRTSGSAGEVSDLEAGSDWYIGSIMRLNPLCCQTATTLL
jgi:hypothetical protein